MAQLDAGVNDTINPGVPVTLTATYGMPGTPVILDDDYVAGPFDIGFSFRFFGENFTQFYLGANGFVSFIPNANSSGIRDPFTIPSISKPQFPREAIFGPWADFLPKPVSTYAFYLSSGAAPNRILTVMWCQVPMYSDPPGQGLCFDSIATFQIILHETINTIENQILIKRSCLIHNDNLANLGLQNRTASIGFAVPGRNHTSWTAYHEGWLYTPVTVDSFAITSVPFHLEPLVPKDKIEYNWYQGSDWVGTGQSVTVTPNETSLYTVHLDLCSGITLKDSVLVFVNPPIPNAFTPNGDGKNDEFRILGLPAENITKYNFMIFNRWGQMIFSTNDITHAWDGTRNGQVCPAGIYVWEIFYEDGKKKQVTNRGTVMLIR